MHFHRAKTKFWTNIIFDDKIGETIVKNVGSYKYLGVIIDSNNNWSEHIEYIKTNLFKIIGVSYKTRYYLNEKSLYFKGYNENLNKLKITK